MSSEALGHEVEVVTGAGAGVTVAAPAEVVLLVPAELGAITLVITSRFFTGRAAWLTAAVVLPIAGSRPELS
jgi:hypothetical protein